MTEPRAPFPISETANGAYRLAVGSIRDLPVASVTLLLLLYAPDYLLDELRRSIDPEHTWARVAVSYAGTVLHAAALAPFAVLVHRRIILGEVEDRYWSAAWTRRTARFFGLCVLVDVGYRLSGDVSQLADTLGIPPGGKVVVGMMLLVEGIRLVLRSVLAFPAIATDQTENPFEMSLSHTRGRSWAVLGTFALANWPLVMLMLAGMWLLPRIGFGLPSITHAYGAVLDAAWLTLNVAIASHLFVHRAAWSWLRYDEVPGIHPDGQRPLT